MEEEKNKLKINENNKEKKKNKKQKKKKINENIEIKKEIEIEIKNEENKINKLENKEKKNIELNNEDIHIKIDDCDDIDDCDIDDDDVPSEMISINWKNPDLIVDKVIEIPPPTITTTATTLISSDLTSTNNQNENEIIQELDINNDFFETPFNSNQLEDNNDLLNYNVDSSSILAIVSSVKSSPDSTPLRSLSLSMIADESILSSDEINTNNQINNVSIKSEYVSAWGQLESPSDDEDNHSNNNNDKTTDKLQVIENNQNEIIESNISDQQEEIIDNKSSINISLEDWISVVLKEIPSFIEPTLSTFSQHQITTILSLLNQKDDLGVKGLKQLGLGTPAAWAIHSALIELSRTVDIQKQEKTELLQLDPSFSEWLTIVLKDTPEYLELTFESFLSKGILSIEKLKEVNNQRDIKDLKIFGIAIPATWSIIKALQLLQENNENNITEKQEKRIWGYLPSDLSSDSDSEDNNDNNQNQNENNNNQNNNDNNNNNNNNDNSFLQQEQSQHNQNNTSSNFRGNYPWRQKFVMVDSSSSDEDDENQNKIEKEEN